VHQYKINLDSNKEEEKYGFYLILNYCFTDHFCTAVKHLLQLNNNNNNNNNLLIAIGLSPGGSGHLTYWHRNLAFKF
jgi:hypothetical protein